MSEIHPSRLRQIEGTKKVPYSQPPKKKPKKPKKEPVRSTSQKIISKNAARNERRKKARQVASLLKAQKTSATKGTISTTAVPEEDKVNEDESAGDKSS
jgi:hypothetical protein